eukprot:m.24763 g.24763  ORF g.24763 m.24763 type:complete len:285 (+) comp28676_c1_seq1:2758-3612(+)
MWYFDTMNHETGNSNAPRSDCLVAAAKGRRSGTIDIIPNVNVAGMSRTSIQDFRMHYPTPQQVSSHSTSVLSAPYARPPSTHYCDTTPFARISVAGPGYAPVGARVSYGCYQQRPESGTSHSSWILPGGVQQGDLVRNGLLPQPSAVDLIRHEFNKTRRLELTPEERQRRQARREKNKVAAAKCRIKRRDHSKQLKEDYEDLEKGNGDLHVTISGLLEEVEKLKEVLTSHQCMLGQEEKAALEEQMKAMLEEPRPAVLKSDVTVSDSDDDSISSSSIDMIENES